MGKPLGVGIYSAALKKGKLDAEGYRAMIASTTLLNRAGAELSTLDGVRAITDVTGFGLLGHALEIARGAKLNVQISLGQVPLLPGVEALARLGLVTGASGRNWAAYGSQIDLDSSVDDLARALLTDPQTSGGLLVSCQPEDVQRVLDVFGKHGCERAAVVGQTKAGKGRVEVLR